jgi:hypothetical protein
MILCQELLFIPTSDLGTTIWEVYTFKSIFQNIFQVSFLHRELHTHNWPYGTQHSFF